MRLYRRGVLSLGRARILAQISRWEFEQLLGERRIPRHYTEADLREDLQLHTLTIPYTHDLLLSLKQSPKEFEAEARLLLAVKLYELGRISTGRAAELAGMSRVEFFFALIRFGLSPIGIDPEELAQDVANA